ncbi:hypothetical protein [Paraburkholderia sp. 35.1]|uniref:hypothetical protein n=1 Tax=Paraburkholderia sp. 35.1 TaxID=2991058 RepID=UPI003D1E6A65
MAKKRSLTQSTAEEEAAIEALLEDLRSQRRQERRNWTASWLLTDLHAITWKLRTSETILVNNEWQSTLNVCWNEKLANGTLLSAPSNDNYRHFLQKTAFLLRENSILDIRANSSFLTEIYNLKTLTNWVYRYAGRYQPASELLNRLDARAIKNFLKDYGTGAAFETGGYPLRFLSLIDIEKKILEKTSQKIENPYELPAPYIDALCRELRTKGFYRRTPPGGVNSELEHLDRIKLSNLLSCDVKEFKSPRAIAFFRQFEPDYIARFGPLCVRVAPLFREYPSHRTSTISEALCSKTAQSSVIRMTTTINAVIQLKERPENFAPSIGAEELSTVSGKFIADAQIMGNTPWIPVEASMIYLDESIRWILTYGPHLVELYAKGLQKFSEKLWLGKASDYARSKRERWLRENIPNELSPLNITGWGPNGALVESNASQYFGLSNAMEVLLGACLYLVTNLLPSRVGEVSYLEKNCLSFATGDGYWITKPREKAGEEGERNVLDLPIPKIVATTIRLLSRISDETKEFAADYSALEGHFLLYLPNFFSVDSLAFSHKKKAHINYALDKFCDFVRLPPDELARRWYVRVHENRKSFLLSFVWYFKYASLDAARWLAGHGNEQQILAYILMEFPHVSISELEADYLAKALWNLSASRKNLGEIKNIEDLYDRVCAHFKVREISDVDFDQLNDWLELRVADESLAIEVVNITTQLGHKRVAFRVKFRKRSKASAADTRSKS